MFIISNWWFLIPCYHQNSRGDFAKHPLFQQRVFASAGVTRRRKESITSTTHIQFTSNLGNYLGFQIHHGRIKKEDFSSIMERVSSKLASWKWRLLNKPGRVTLANSVLTAIPAYSMQIQWLPQYVCDHLDKTVHNFIWKGSTNKGMNMVGWEKLLNLRRMGVLEWKLQGNKTLHYLVNLCGICLNLVIIYGLKFFQQGIYMDLIFSLREIARALLFGMPL